MALIQFEYLGNPQFAQLTVNTPFHHDPYCWWHLGHFQRLIRVPVMAKAKNQAIMITIGPMSEIDDSVPRNFLETKNDRKNTGR
jgi:hypothetical protein